MSRPPRKPDVFLPPIIVERHETRSLSQTVDWANTYHKASSFYGKSRGEGAVIFILDTAGTFQDHQDLASNNDTRLNANFTDHPDKDSHGHGTHCAGIAAAIDNGIGVIGIAPNATLAAVKVLNDFGSGSSVDIADGIRYVADLELPPEHKGKKKIISGSLGGSSPMANVKSAIDYALSKGVWIIFAAGNSGYSGNDTIKYPAKYDDVIAVGSIKKDESPSTFSSGGPSIDVAAYGDGNYSTYKDNSYATLRGTSMATPVVSGIAALLANEYDWLEDQDDLMNAFRKYAKDLFEDGFDHRTGYGSLLMDKFKDEEPDDDEPDEPDEPSEPDEPTVPAYWQQLWTPDVFTTRARRFSESSYTDIKVTVTYSAKVESDEQIKEAIAAANSFWDRRFFVTPDNYIAKDFLAAFKRFFEIIIPMKGIPVRVHEMSIEMKGAKITQKFSPSTKQPNDRKAKFSKGGVVKIDGCSTVKLPTYKTKIMDTYGIEAIKAGFETAEGLYNLYDAVYLDDKKINGEDLVDLVRLGPGVATDMVKFVNKAKDLGKEWDDLSDEELTELFASIDDLPVDPHLEKIVKSLLQLSVDIDRYAESKKGRTSR